MPSCRRRRWRRSAAPGCGGARSCRALCPRPPPPSPGALRDPAPPGRVGRVAKTKNNEKIRKKGNVQQNTGISKTKNFSGRIPKMEIFQKNGRFQRFLEKNGILRRGGRGLLRGGAVVGALPAVSGTIQFGTTAGVQPLGPASPAVVPKLFCTGHRWEGADHGSTAQQPPSSSSSGLAKHKTGGSDLGSGCRERAVRCGGIGLKSAGLPPLLQGPHPLEFDGIGLNSASNPPGQKDRVRERDGRIRGHRLTAKCWRIQSSPSHRWNSPWQHQNSPWQRQTSPSPAGTPPPSA
eukprot:1190598-Prorocentrum_minimum.AAC.3